MLFKLRRECLLLLIISLIPTVSFAKTTPNQDIKHNTEQICLARAIYHEARGEKPIQAKTGIAKVLINRTKHPEFPKTICNVINDKKHTYQFSWVKKKSKVDITSKEWYDAVELSNLILTKSIRLPNFNENVLYFNNTSLGRNYKLVSRYGNTKFFEKRV